MSCEPGAAVYPNDVDIISDPSDLPADRSKIPGDTLITTEVWAALQGVAVQTVRRNKVLSDARRRNQENFDVGMRVASRELPRPGDMPAASERFGGSPGWYMSAYRAWEAARPGRGAGAGRPAGRGKGRGKRVTLPLVCPHCHQGITEKHLERQGRARPAAATPSPKSPQAVFVSPENGRRRKS